MSAHRTRRALALAGALALLAACGGDAPGPGASGAEAAAGASPRSHGILVIAIDGLRADHVGHLGYDRATTPTLDALAAEGVSLTQAMASAPRLLPSHVSLLTGCDPNVARRVLPADIAAPPERRWRIPDEVPRVAVELLSHGFATAAFVDHPDLSPLYGFAHGFQEFVESGGHSHPPEGDLTERLLQWLRSVDRDRPWFAYLDLQGLERAWSRPRPDCEAYFERRRELDQVPPVASSDDVFFAIPRSRWRGGSRSLGQYEAMYDGHLWCLDGELEELFGALRVAGRWEDTTVVVVGTYGVQFGEAGLYLASGRYSMADLHVPCIVRPARSLELPPERRGAREDGLVSLVDLAPTVLELGGVPVPSGTHGRSRVALLFGEPEAAPREYVVASCGMQEGCAVIGPRFCLEYLLPGQAEEASLGRSWFGRDVEESALVMRFYDRLADPNPPPDVGAVGDDPAALPFRERALQWFEHITLTREYLQSSPRRRAATDPAVIARLRALGYLAEGDAP